MVYELARRVSLKFDAPSSTSIIMILFIVRRTVVSEEPNTASESQILDESRRVRRLQFVVDFTLSVLAQSEMPVEEAAEMVAATRRFAVHFFPEKGPTYDLIYQPRFQRLMAEKYGVV